MWIQKRCIVASICTVTADTGIAALTTICRITAI
jgi:hypothetical protein